MMRPPVHRIALFALMQLFLLSACGGGGSSNLAPASGNNGGGGVTTGGGGGTTGGGGGTTGGGGQNITGPNVVAITVDQGPAGLQSSVSLNTPFISVTVCAPGSTTACQTIDHIQVDTGSYGLRIISSTMSSTLLQALPPAMASGAPIVECTAFADGFSWGSVHNADLHISSETASNIPIQIIGDPAFPNVPSACQSNGPPENTVDTFGANGILGVGPFVQDCVDCDVSTGSGAYYTCSNNNNPCTPTIVQKNQIVSNPVASFTTDNNGVVLEMSSVPDAGSLTGTGVLIFGIDTQSNNMLGSATVLTTDAIHGYITVNYKGTQYPKSFIDSGSNLFFLNDTISTCNLGTASQPQQFFCPASELRLSAINMGANNMPSTVGFNVANASTQFSNNQSFTAFDNVAAPNPDPQSFDFGMPFFYGRNVFTAIELRNTSGGPGPFFAY